MKKYFIALAMIPILFGLIGMAVYQTNAGQWTRTKVAAMKQMTIEINGTHIRIEIAETDAQRMQGLGKRLAMKDDQGMLFVFDRPWTYEFWMKDMNFPIDILWLNHGTVIDIATLAAPKAGELPARHKPKEEADRVLELNRGMAQRLGIEIGSHLIVE